MTAENSPSALLAARDLTFLRQDEPVFGPLDFALRAGEVVLVEGDNGSGKTTLMRVVVGLLHADEGTLYLDGAPLDRDLARGRLLFLAHHLGLKADLSPLENLRIAIGLYGCREAITPQQALHTVGLQGYEHEPVRQLSAGQKKRSALARLLLVPADIWLLDEPFANLDREGIALVNRLIERHVAEGGAAMVTSHGAVTFLHGEPRRLRLSA
ncbi:MULTISPECIES: cytochrome c biogenesis heme-transporting ATPase CcmA [Oleiagrimonas]|uniref:Cytochrome c biogenesis heme-transporting ATPase CcmA n=1 Tax=Oleiagrimonas citrea TaxID=1665687 RepID=A0A846ZNN5_9GAMM|nr:MULTISPECIES: cytochrome c biogenesis heme-transporting ATPase CcmA [Oleiagrimonas]NKZ39063.1 cytochrome c biogenesis heme-transporting ATPase CcmA [Oleiagrimonas citrea]RAP58045.1 heme ABC transporter ATP-binding protein CcmA [Oleiagrimonas sp. MCCC 1A03011]